MFFTNSSGRYQPYIAWKGGKGTYSARPGWSRPIPTNGSDLAPPFKPRPIKHWRKQLIPNDNTSRTSQLIPFDRPGSTVYLGVNSEDCKECGEDAVGIVSHILNNKNNKCNPECNPKNKIIRSGLQEKKINNGQEYCYSSSQYLKKRCRTYNQKLSNGNGSSSLVDASKFSYVISTCEEPCSNGKPKTLIYNPNNPQYGVQGAVDSSSRIQRLKYNTITKAAASLKAEFGSEAANAAKYTSNGASPYFIKSKIDFFPKKTLHHKDGNKTICPCN